VKTGAARTGGGIRSDLLLLRSLPLLLPLTEEAPDLTLLVPIDVDFSPCGFKVNDFFPAGPLLLKSGRGGRGKDLSITSTLPASDDPLLLEEEAEEWL